jgi:sugar transferase (PEP-CTERM/EpsH1 system associated)
MRILFLQKRILFPTDTGGTIRTLNVLRHLARWHAVTYLCSLQPGQDGPLSEMRKLGVRLETIPWRETPRGSLRFYVELGMNLFSRFPFTVNKDYDPRLRQRANELLKAESFDLVICDFVQMARNAIGLPAPAKILFEHNVEAQIFRRHARTDSSRLRRLYMRHQWHKMRRFEARAGRQFDAVIAVSQRDRQIFESEYGWDHVQVIDTAVDVDYFKPNGAVEKRDRVVFVGSMDWLPNQDGVEHFVNRIWPEIRRQRPTATFQIVGRNPSPAVRRLERTPGVGVVGAVPDVRPYLAEAAVVVVPLLVGGGTRIKIFEAMAMEKAVVSTSLGAEGLDVTPGEHIALADTPSEFAGTVCELLENADHRARLAANGRRLVAANYSAVTIARQFDDICRQTVEAVLRGADRVQATISETS